MQNLLSNLTFVVAEDFNDPETITPRRVTSVQDGMKLSHLIERNAQYEALKRDFRAAPTAIELQTNGKFTINGEGSYTLESHALRQAAQRIGLAASNQAAETYCKPNIAGALAAKDTELYITAYPQHFAPIWNAMSAIYEGTGNGDRTVLARTYADNTIRAYMSDKFSAIDNGDMLNILNGFLEDENHGQYKLVRPYLSRDEVVVDVIFPTDTGSFNIKHPGDDDPRGGYGFGVRITTGEIGNRSPKVMPLIQRHSCTNSIVVDADGTSVTVKQQGNKETKLQLLIAAIGNALTAAPELVNKLIAARRMTLPKMSQLVSSMVDKHGWNEEVQFSFTIGTENHESVWGIVNGLTYAAHNVDMPAADAIAMEEYAGQILWNPRILNTYKIRD